jgi:hypothetical protein
MYSAVDFAQKLNEKKLVSHTRFCEKDFAKNILDSELKSLNIDLSPSSGLKIINLMFGGQPSFNNTNTASCDLEMVA